MAWKPSKKIELNNSHQIGTWRQVLEKEAKLAGNKTKKDMEKHEAILYNKNTYMNLYKNEDEINKETIREQKGGEYVYDQVRHDYDEGNKGYNQKDKRESLWSNQVKPRAEPKAVQGAPLTTT